MSAYTCILTRHITLKFIFLGSLYKEKICILFTNIILEKNSIFLKRLRLLSYLHLKLHDRNFTSTFGIAFPMCIPTHAECVVKSPYEILHLSYFRGFGQ